MEIALALLAAVVVLAVGYEFYKKYYGAVRHIEEAELAPKEEVVAEAKPNPIDREALRSDINERYENTLRSLSDDVEVTGVSPMAPPSEEIYEARKAAAPKVKAAKKATSKKSVAVEEAAPVVKKPKIKIAK
jgi:hypothetical protein